MPVTDTTSGGTAPSLEDWEAAARTEERYRRVMQYATDQMWALQAHELGMALLHDVLDDAQARQERETTSGGESQP